MPTSTQFRRVTDQDRAYIKAHPEEGKTFIAEKLGLTPGQVKYELKKLGLTGRFKSPNHDIPTYYISSHSYYRYKPAKKNK